MNSILKVTFALGALLACQLSFAQAVKPDPTVQIAQGAPAAPGAGAAGTAGGTAGTAGGTATGAAATATGTAAGAGFGVGRSGGNDCGDRREERYRHDAHRGYAHSVIPGRTFPAKAPQGAFSFQGFG